MSYDDPMNVWIRPPRPWGFWVSLVITTAIVCWLAGCKSPETRAGEANAKTRDQTAALATQVNAIGAATNDADAITTDVANDPRLPADLRAKLNDAHRKHEAVKTAIVPIGTTIIPRINSAADDALRAELAAQNEQNRKVYYVAALAVGLAVFVGCMKLHFGPSVSAIAGALAAVLMGVVIGVLSSVLTHLLHSPLFWVGCAVALAGYLVEVKVKGGFAAAMHGWFDAAKREAANLPADLRELKARVAAIEAPENDPPAAGQTADHV